MNWGEAVSKFRAQIIKRFRHPREKRKVESFSGEGSGVNLYEDGELLPLVRITKKLLIAFLVRGALVYGGEA